MNRSLLHGIDEFNINIHKLTKKCNELNKTFNYGSRCSKAKLN